MIHKMDRHLISKQKWEIEYVADKIAKEGFLCTRHNVLEALKVVGRSRRKVYNHLRRMMEKIKS